MKANRIFALFIVIALMACNTSQSSMSGSKSGKWKSLFNGKNLDGWTMKISGSPVGENANNTFRVNDGVLNIRYDQYGDDFADRFGGLYYDKEFTNYRLLAEYRFVGETAPGAPVWGYRDSGLQYHAQSAASMGMNQSFPVCLEYNFHGGNGTDDRPLGEICANGINVVIDGTRTSDYCNSATVKRTFHGDQWVTIEIDVQGDQIKHFVNGEEILHFEKPLYKADHDLGKAFIKDGNNVVDHGFISLQSNSHPIDFRRIEIMEY